jgi:hypothetical protein
MHSVRRGRAGSRPSAWTALLAALSAALCMPTGAFADPWLQDHRQAPLHPTIITADYKDKSYPVIAASAEVPEIEVEGKLRKLYSDQSYQTPRAVGFAPGFVTFKAQKASSNMTTMSTRLTGPGMAGSGLVPSGTTSEKGEYECTLVSSGAHAGCYLAVVFFRVDDGGSPLAGSTAIAFREIGDLAAGKETKVTIDGSYFAPPGVKAAYFPMVFSKGLEIRTDQSENAAVYFRRGEMAVHGALLAHYRQQNPASDKPASAYLRFRPELPPGVDPRSLPPTITAKFAVTESGEVDAVEIDQVLDVKVDQEIRRALGGWLFMPRLRKGYPVRTMITVPLSFAQASS